MSQHKFFDEILRLVAPVKCMGCREVTLESVPFCPECAREFALLAGEACPVCGRQKKDCTCPGGRKNAFLFYYGSPFSKKIIASLKYHATSFKIEYIAGLLQKLVPQGVTFDAVVYPPRSVKNKMRYGFDQSEMLAAALARRLSLPCVKALKRTKTGSRGKAQKLLSASQRIKNVRGAFEVDASALDGIRNVILVDDVMTTGATMTECTRILKNAGVKRVYGMTVAKTPKALRAVYNRRKNSYRRNAY